jgi:hypothetical protein
VKNSQAAFPDPATLSRSVITRNNLKLLESDPRGLRRQRRSERRRDGGPEELRVQGRGHSGVRRRSARPPVPDEDPARGHRKDLRAHGQPGGRHLRRPAVRRGRGSRGLGELDHGRQRADARRWRKPQPSMGLRQRVLQVLRVPRSRVGLAGTTCHWKRDLLW